MSSRKSPTSLRQELRESRLLTLRGFSQNRTILSPPPREFRELVRSEIQRADIRAHQLLDSLDDHG
jgi:hypothetical protein